VQKETCGHRYGVKGRDRNVDPEINLGPAKRPESQEVWILIRVPGDFLSSLMCTSHERLLESEERHHFPQDGRERQSGGVLKLDCPLPWAKN
jgi:hypothetical protein